uniref:Reverse transcriptase domain-containing protein n=1 Tax=Gouania willdenowi TaxID=441366 RepID=A0A8C5DHY8_GOUWI
MSNRFKHGCSLSPLLFNIGIEPLAQLIRDDNDIQGFSINGQQHKLSLYADDVLLSISNPATIPHLKDLIKGIKYLGIQIPPSLIELYNTNNKVIKGKIKTRSGMMDNMLMGEWTMITLKIWRKIKQVFGLPK